MTLSESEIRKYVLAAYRQGFAKSYGDVSTYVATRKPPPHRLEPAEEASFRQVMWELAMQGVVSPRGAEVGELLRGVRLTDYGQACVSQEHVLPHDIDGYLGNLKNCMGQACDGFVLQYAKEALECFHRNNLRAAVVMLGVAAERSLDMLKDAYTQRLDEQERSKAVPKLNARHLRDRFNYLWSRIQKAGMPEELQDRLEGDFWGAFQLIRRSRNDAGHFTVIETDKLTAVACLASFPGFVSTLSKLVVQLKQAEKP